MKKTSMDTDGAVAAQDVDVRPPLHSTTDTTFITGNKMDNSVWEIKQYGFDGKTIIVDDRV